MAGLALLVAAWWLACALLTSSGCVLIGFAVRNIRRELGGRVMLACGIVLVAAGVAGLVVYGLT